MKGVVSQPACGEVLSLRFLPPLDAAGLFTFLQRRAIPAVEQMDGLVYRRTFRRGGPGRPLGGWLEVGVDEADSALRVTIWPAAAAAAAADDVVARCRRLFDLDLVPGEVEGVLGADPALAPLLAATPGLRVPGAWDGFELAVRAVLGQQVSVAAARTLLGRLVAMAGPRATDSAEVAVASQSSAPGSGPPLDRLFPSAAEVVEADLEALGVPASRRRTLRALAEAVESRKLSLEPGADAADTCARLQELPGVGPWTAAYVALRALGDADSLLVGDLALARGAARCGLPDRWPDLVRHAERWRPWRGYASLLLWSA